MRGGIQTIRIVSLGTWVTISDQTEMERVISALRCRGYTPLIRSMITGMLTAAGIQDTDNSELIQRILTPESLKTDLSYADYENSRSKELLGELFVTSEVLYGIRSRMSASTYDTRTEIYAVGDGRQTKALSKFCSEVENAMRSSLKYIDVNEIKFSWKSTNPFFSNELHDVFLTEGGIMDSEGCLIRRGSIVSPDYTDEETQAAAIFLDASTREFLKKLAERSQSTENDERRQSEIDPLGTLISNGLIKREYLTTCRQDQHTIGLFPSKDRLAAESNTPQSCNVCGRLYTEENIQQVYSLTKKGKHLVTGSLWMYVWITELLRRNGVEKNGIIWKVEAGGEDIDIVAEDFGSRFLFELKDKEFGLGDAYALANRVPRFGGKVGIVITTDRVSNDAKDFFAEKSSSIDFWYLEGVDQIQMKFKTIVERMALPQVRSLVRTFSDATRAELWPVVEQWLAKITEETEGEKGKLGRLLD